MPTGRRLLALFAPVVAGALVVAACSGDDDGGTGAPTSGSSTSTAAASTTRPATTTSAPTSTAPGSTTPAGRTTPTLRQVPITKGATDLDYDATGAYPQLDGLPDAVGAKVNAALAAAANGIVSRFERDLRDFGEVPGAGDVRSFVEVAPTAELLTPEVASLRLDVLVYAAGAAHPGSQIVTANFDLATGAQLGLGDLFDGSKPWLQTIADKATAQLTTTFATLGADPPFPEGVAPTADNYQAWWVTTKGLGIGFPQGQAGPTALGNQEVSIPWADLQPLVSPTGVAAALAR